MTNAQRRVPHWQIYANLETGRRFFRGLKSAISGADSLHQSQRRPHCCIPDSELRGLLNRTGRYTENRGTIWTKHPFRFSSNETSNILQYSRLHRCLMQMNLSTEMHCCEVICASSHSAGKLSRRDHQSLVSWSEKSEHGRHQKYSEPGSQRRNCDSCQFGSSS